MFTSIGGVIESRPSGRSGLQTPPLTIALGHGSRRPSVPLRPLVRHAIDLGITSFDVTCPSDTSTDQLEEIGFALAPWLKQRHSIHISARFGLGTWPTARSGHGSRGQLLASLNGLLRLTGLDYLDVIYMHRRSSEVDIEESSRALCDAVRQGLSLYAGLSSLSPSITSQMSTILAELGFPVASYQTTYSLLSRWAEEDLLEILNRRGIGFTACAPLAHGLLTASRFSYSDPSASIDDYLFADLVNVASSRDQMIEQMALSWVLQKRQVSSAIVTATQFRHLSSLRDSLDDKPFSSAALQILDQIYKNSQESYVPTPEHYLSERSA
ncbi:aldo/keto reductase [Streptomyces sp. NPDC090112]|uniref:aldo/keto reductase n=1 Tax=Streptomyces sp. NPDC090112 TaxID=3365949 RepID=UPI00380C77F2